MNSRVRIGLVIVLGLGLRLIHVTSPIVGYQSWRQSDTAAIARNYAETGLRFAYPQIDWRGDGSGDVETEFPLYPYLVALLYQVLGQADWIGRVLSALFSLGTIGGIYQLGRRFLGERRGLIAAAVYAMLPLNVYYGRAFMPESAMLMCSVWGVVHFSRWVDEQRLRNQIFASVFIALAVLLKLPCLYLGLPLLFLLIVKEGPDFLKRRATWLFAALVLVPVAGWYYHAHQLYQQSGLSFGIWNVGSDKWGMIGPLLTPKFWNDVIFKSIAERHLTYAGFLFFVIGLLVKRVTREERVFDWWLIALLVFILLVPIGNQVHDYYQLPMTIPAVMFVAKGVEFLWLFARSASAMSTRWTACMTLGILLLGLIVLAGVRLHSFVEGETKGTTIVQLGKEVQSVTEEGALVVAVDNGDPVYLYHARRKGWHSFPRKLDSPLLDERIGRGAKYLFSDFAVFERDGKRSLLDSLMQRYTILSETDAGIVLRLAPKKKGPH